MNGNKKKIIKLFKNLPIQDSGKYPVKSCQELSDELGIEIKIIIDECHELQQRDLLGLSGQQSHNGKLEHEKTTYTLSVEGRKSLDVNWTQQAILLCSIIAAAGVLLTVGFVLTPDTNSPLECSRDKGDCYETTLLRVIDGDTIVTQNNDSIRFALATT